MCMYVCTGMYVCMYMYVHASISQCAYNIIIPLSSKLCSGLVHSLKAIVVLGTIR